MLHLPLIEMQIKCIKSYLIDYYNSNCTTSMAQNCQLNS